MNILERILDELNPLNDFEEFTRSYDPHSFETRTREMSEDRTYAVGMAKPLIRGLVVGGLLGALGYYLAGKGVNEGMVKGGLIMEIIDFSQYMARGLYARHKARRQDNKKEDREE